MEILEYIALLFKKDAFGMSLAVVGTMVGVFGLSLQIKILYKRKRTVKDIMMDLDLKTAAMRRAALELPEDERTEADEKLVQLDKIICKFYEEDRSKSFNKNQEGFIDQSFLLYGVPATIALTFTFALVYLLIANQKVVDYQTPEILKTGITTIIGYYFGVAVKDKPDSIPSIEAIEELRKQAEEEIIRRKR